MKQDIYIYIYCYAIHAFWAYAYSIFFGLLNIFFPRHCFVPLTNLYRIHQRTIQSGDNQLHQG